MTTTSSIPTVSPIVQIETLYDRLSKARALVANGKVHPVVNMPSHYAVEGNVGFYIVNGSCCCNDAAKRSELIKGHCKHRLAALLYAEQPAKQRPTPQSYPQSLN
jgi:hypothetical protein